MQTSYMLKTEISLDIIQTKQKNNEQKKIV